jgi:hypothetical protein
MKNGRLICRQKSDVQMYILTLAEKNVKTGKGIKRFYYFFIQMHITTVQIKFKRTTVLQYTKSLKTLHPGEIRTLDLLR